VATFYIVLYYIVCLHEYLFRFAIHSYNRKKLICLQSCQSVEYNVLGRQLAALPRSSRLSIPSMLWKQAQQEVRQHWFIDSYIAAYIQVQYKVTGVHPTGLTVARGVGRCPQCNIFHPIVRGLHTLIKGQPSQNN
jgi:hypothetical protein